MATGKLKLQAIKAQQHLELVVRAGQNIISGFDDRRAIVGRSDRNHRAFMLP
jgi:hypothetical protein